MPNTTAEFIEFLRRNIGDLENVTNGNRYRLDGRDMFYVRPNGVSDDLLEKIVQAALDLKMEKNSLVGYYDFWYDPL